jgi:glycosyltransferase involved in cell wall biosynthesis
MRTGLPKVSIITPTYNAQKLIESCVRSVSAQTYRNIEHIVIDGGSEDGTIEALSAYPHLRWISEKDEGIYDAMNKGIRMSEGEWIYFLGSDDVLKHDDILTDIFAHRNVSGLDVVYGDVEWGDTGTTYDGEFTLAKLLQHNICHQAIFFRKEVFDTYGYYDQSYRSLADWEMNIRLFANDRISITYVPLTIAKYRLGGYSSTFHDEKFFRDRPEFIDKYIASRHAGAYRELLSLKESIEGLHHQIRQRESEFQDMTRNMAGEIAGLNQTIQSRNSELETMKSSVLWKVWKKYRKMKRIA